ncbi:MAG: cache domain-containing protein [Proteobacteria bacterium]|nr:cache domain-containing protein [Pseudomonadota bacterium]
MFLPLALVLVLAAYAVHIVEERRRVKLTLDHATSEVDSGTRLITSELQGAISGLLYLSNFSEMERIFYSKLSREGTNSLLHFIKTSGLFDQIRFLDNRGMEVLRINYNQGKPALVPEDQLQNKASRYYFIESTKLDDGQIFVSPLDLNVEHGKVELPPKPMIRFSTPILGNMGERLGYVIVNYAGNSMLKTLATIPTAPGSQLMLLNSDGYWLKGPSHYQEWAFMFDVKKDISFANQYPEAWRTIAGKWETQRNTSLGTFVSNTVCITDIVDQYTHPRTGQGATCWKLVSHTPQSVLNDASAELRNQILAVVGLLLLLFALGSLLLAHLRTRSRSAETLVLKQIESNARFVPREFLGLLNKTTFTDVDITDHVQRPMTTLFTDIRSYSSISESMSPQQVLAFLNA